MLSAQRRNRPANPRSAARIVESALGIVREEASTR